MNARERRRQKLRLSQNDSGSGDLKPPILRRLEAKAQKSEIFYNAERRPSSDASGHKVSKSCNDMGSDKNRPLVDSLKIFRNINPVAGYQPNLPRFAEESNGSFGGSKPKKESSYSNQRCMFAEYLYLKSICKFKFVDVFSFHLYF